MIAGMNDDIQGGICYGGIAHSVPPRFQRAMWCDQVNDYLVGPVLSNTSFTIEAYVYIHTFATLHGITIWPFGEMAIWPIAGVGRVRIVYGSPRKYTRDSTSPYGIQPKTWTHLMGSYDGVTPTIWVNGNKILPAQTATDNFAFAMPSVLRVGTSINTTILLYHGVISRLRIYDRAVSDVEAAQLYVGGENVIGGLLAYYKNTGNTLADWQDYSGSDNHITTINGTPSDCYVLGNNKISLNGVIQNP